MNEFTLIAIGLVGLLTWLNTISIRIIIKMNQSHQLKLLKEFKK